MPRSFLIRTLISGQRGMLGANSDGMRQRNIIMDRARAEHYSRVHKCVQASPIHGGYLPVTGTSTIRPENHYSTSHLWSVPGSRSLSGCVNVVWSASLL